MANFNKAILWLKQGKKVRRPTWDEGSYWKLGKEESIQWINGTHAHIHLNQINAKDFEIYEVKEFNLKTETEKWADKWIHKRKKTIKEINDEHKGHKTPLLWT